MEAQRDLEGERGVGTGAPRTGNGDAEWPGRSDRAPGKFQPGLRLLGPAEPQFAQPGTELQRGGRVDLGRGQQVGHRVEVDADADATLRTGLQSGRAPTAERIEYDIPRAAVSGDKGVRERRGEHRQIAAHRVKGMAPQPLLVLPVGLDCQAGQLGSRGRRKADLELARSRARSDRHGRGQTSWR